MRDSAVELDRRLRQSVAGTTIASTLGDKARQAKSWSILQWAKAGLIAGIIVPSLTVVLPLLISYGIHNTLGLARGLALASMFWTTLAGAVAWILASRLHRSRGLAIASVLPVADHAVVRESWSGACAIALIGLYLNLWIVGCLAIAGKLGLVWGVTSAAAALGQCALCMALGALLFVYAPAIVWRTCTLCGAIGVVLYLVGHGGDAGWMNATTKALYFVMPSGWLNAPLTFGFQMGGAASWWWLAPAALCLFAGQFAYRRLLRTYRIYEFFPDQNGTALAVTSFGDPRQIGFVGRLWRWMTGSLAELSFDDVELLTVDSAKNCIRTREFLSLPAGARRTLVERGQRFWLSRRENAIYDYLTNDDGTWSQIWLLVTGLAGLLMLASAVLEKVASPHFWLSPQVPAAVLFVVVSGFGVLSIFIGPWVGMTSSGAARAAPPRFGQFPIGFGEISRVIVKIVAARVLLVFPLYVASFGLLVFGYRRDLVWQGQLVLIAAPFVAFFAALAGQGYLIGWKFNNAATFGRLSSRNIWWFVALWIISPFAMFPALYVTSLAFTLMTSTLWGPIASSLWGIALFLILVFSALFAGSFAVWLVARESYRRSVADLAVTGTKSFQLSLRTVDQGISVAHRRRALRRRYGWLWWLRKPDHRRSGTPSLENVGQGGSRSP